MKVATDALIQKLRAEKAEIDARIAKLGKVLHSTDAECAIRAQISSHQFDLLELQYMAMLSYSQILNMRICNLLERGRNERDAKK